LKEENWSRFKNEQKFIRRPIKEIVTRLRKSDLTNKVYTAIEEEQHWKAASKRWSGWTGSVEAPHDSVHVCVGFPMSTVNYAGFDPTFFIHHCQVDRLYESYIKAHPDSKEEFKSMQLSLEQSDNETNRFTNPYEPFKLNGKPFMPEDGFDTEALGYKYDKLIEPRPQQLRQMPTFAVFNNINIMEMNGKCYSLFVSVIKTEDSKDWKAPEDLNTIVSDDNFAGIGSVFGRGGDCQNCKQRKPFSIHVDITSTLNQLGISRYEASLRVMTEDQDGIVLPLEETPVPSPTIEGPYFQSGDEMLSIVDEEGSKKQGAITRGDTLQMQKLLKKYGWYEGKQDGWFGEKTSKAVSEFQSRYGLKVDSLCGPKTKEVLMAPRFDGIPDQKELKDDEKKLDTWSDEVLYWVGSIPGYMPYNEVLSEIDTAFKQWGDKVGIIFKRNEEKSNSKITITWSDCSNDNLFLFDGKGGELARAGSDYITFDFAEKWYVQSQKDQAKPNEYGILPVVFHEIGHCLGFPHSSNNSAVMAPYYVSDRISFTSADDYLVKINLGKINLAQSV